jgi:hypothetical protein
VSEKGNSALAMTVGGAIPNQSCPNRLYIPLVSSNRVKDVLKFREYVKNLKDNSRCTSSMILKKF